MISCLNCTAQLTDTSIVNNLRRHFKATYSHPRRDLLARKTWFHQSQIYQPICTNLIFTKGHGENTEDIVLCGKTTEIAYLTQFCSNQRMSENKVPLKHSLSSSHFFTHSLTHSRFATFHFIPIQSNHIHMVSTCYPHVIHM